MTDSTARQTEIACRRSEVMLIRYPDLLLPNLFSFNDLPLQREVVL